MNRNIIQLMCYLTGILFVIGSCIIVFLAVRALTRGFKNFLFELIDHINGAGTKTTTSRKDYTAEARDACEKVTPKRKREETPPWEK